MKITGLRTRAMFSRYNIASFEDKLDALQKARVYADSRARVTSNVASIESRKQAADRTHVAIFLRKMVGRVGLEPTTTGLKGRCSTN